jgi:hypothetical protein
MDINHAQESISGGHQVEGEGRDGKCGEHKKMLDVENEPYLQ